MKIIAAHGALNLLINYLFRRNSTGDLGGGDLYVAGGCQTQIWPVVKDIRCNGFPTHRIEFTPPSTWKASVNYYQRVH